MTHTPRASGKARRLLAWLAALALLAAIAAPASAQIPGGVRVTSVGDSTFTVSWATAAAAAGSIRYGTSPADLSARADDPRGASTTHSVAAGSLAPSTTYYFDVYTGRVRDDNGGAHYQVTTGPRFDPRQPQAIYGQASRAGGASPEGILVYVVITDADGAGSPGSSAPLSTIVREADQGYWSLNLDKARLPDQSGPFLLGAGDNIQLQLVGGLGLAVETTLAVANAAPAPPLVVPGPPAATATATAPAAPTAAPPAATPTPTAPPVPTATPAPAADSPSPTPGSVAQPTVPAASPSPAAPSPTATPSGTRATPVAGPSVAPGASVTAVAQQTTPGATAQVAASAPPARSVSPTAPAPAPGATPAGAPAEAQPRSEDPLWLLLVLGLAGSLLLVGALIAVLLVRYLAGARPHRPRRAKPAPPDEGS